MFIKYQKIKRDKEGRIVSGSASLIKTIYTTNKDGNRNLSHTSQKTIMKLGSVIWINKDNPKQGIFNNPIFGLMYYDADKEESSEVFPDDPRLKGTTLQMEFPRVHINFGNSYLFLSVLEKAGYMNILRRTFTTNSLYQKVVAHLTHDCLKNGSFIKCGEYIKTDILSYILTDIPISTLDCDSSYFKTMSDDNIKRKFFKELLVEKRKQTPDFGRGCYVDSTPLPGESENNPFNALSSHGTDGLTTQSRLVLILDIITHIPVWFEIIPGNVLDKSTIETVIIDLKTTLDLDVDMYDLDAGYAREELFEHFNRTNSSYVDEYGTKRDHTVLVKMPAILGYPYNDLYVLAKPNIYDPDYLFTYEGHTYFGERFEVDIFGYPMYAFVFVDKTQAESLLRMWFENHQDEWKDFSHLSKEWMQVKHGFFILLGNKDQTPLEAIVEYRGRAHIESFFRDGKAYLRILPLGKWTKETISGKIFHDILEMIFYRCYRKNIADTHLSINKLIVLMNSWQCIRTTDTNLVTWPPKKQVREAMEKLGYTCLSHYDLSKIKQEILEGIPMTRDVVKKQSRASNKTCEKKISPEEKIQATEDAKKATQEAKAAKQKEREEAKAAKQKEREEAKAAKQKEREEAKAAKQKEREEAKAAKQKEREEAKATKQTGNTRKSDT